MWNKRAAQPVVGRRYRSGSGHFWATSGLNIGLCVRWVDGENWLAVQLPTSDQKARIRRRLGGDATSVLATSATTLSLTSGTWYTAKVLVDDDLANSALQRLRFWVDTDGDGEFSDETTLLDSTAVDNDWSAGMVGLQRGAGGSATHQWDDFKVGYDNNADGDIDDAPDDTLADDNFNTNSVTLTYDSNGNLTGDGVWTYTYDAWDRIIEAKVGEAFGYGVRWYPDGRLARRITVWTEIHLGDHGATTYERSLTEYYLHTWGGIAEIIDGGGRTLQQLCWDVPAQRRLVFYDVNGELTENDCDPDVTASGEVASADKRYFVSYDDEGRATALTGYTSGGGGDNGKIIERYAYLPDGRGVALSGDGGAGETGALRPASQYGLTLAPFDTRDHDNPGGPRYCAAWVCLPDAPDVSGAPPRPPTCDPGQVAVGGRCVPEVVSPPPPIGPPAGPCLPGMVEWGTDGCVPEWVYPNSVPKPWGRMWPNPAEHECARAYCEAKEAVLLARQAGGRKDGHDGGQTDCGHGSDRAKGRPCFCVFEKVIRNGAVNATPGLKLDSRAITLLIECARVHEMSHVVDYLNQNTCDEFWGGPDPDRNTTECNAWLATWQCLYENMGSICGDDLHCYGEVFAVVANISGGCEEQCSDASMCDTWRTKVLLRAAERGKIRITVKPRRP